MASRSVPYSKLDPGIREAVRILTKAGIKTFESCEGGDGHAYHEPTVRFFGDELDLFKAYDTCQRAGLYIQCVRRVYAKEIWNHLFNEIVFYKHPKTGTIYLPS